MPSLTNAMSYISDNITKDEVTGQVQATPIHISTVLAATLSPMVIMAVGILLVLLIIGILLYKRRKLTQANKVQYIHHITATELDFALSIARRLLATWHTMKRVV